MTEESAERVDGHLRLRLGLQDTHYPHGLIPAATILRLFGDCAAEVAIRMDGTEGHLAAYEKAEFFKPARAGDYIEIRARDLGESNGSRRISLEARRCMESTELGGGVSGAIFHDPAQLVASAVVISVRALGTRASEGGEPITKPAATLRVRLGTQDTHYANGLIPAASVMRLIADCTTEIGIRENGRPGLLAAYEKTDFLQPLWAGDYVEIRAAVLSRGRRSRRIALEVWRLMRAPAAAAAHGDYATCEPPELVARGTMISVGPKQAAESTP